MMPKAVKRPAADILPYLLDLEADSDPGATWPEVIRPRSPSISGGSRIRPFASPTVLWS